MGFKGFFIGDVHSCVDELKELLVKLGFVNGKHPEERKIVWLGDYVDRGPDAVGVLRIVMDMCKAGHHAVIGNHDEKLYRFLKGNPVKLKHGLSETVKQLEAQPESFRNEVRDFLGSLPYELILDDGKVSASHAGLPEHLQDKTNRTAEAHALYGSVDGSVDENGFPVRRDWAQSYYGTRIVIHGHVPIKNVGVKNNVWDLDTGACFGNKLTALKYPEMTLEQVSSFKNYQPFHPFNAT